MNSAVTSGGKRRRGRVARPALRGVAALAAVVTALLGAATPSPAQAGPVTLIYVGAEDCAPCRVWQNGDGAQFRQTAEFARIGYVEVKSPVLHDILKDEYWPEPVRGYRDLLKRSDGVPLWLVVSDGKVIEQRFGPTAWRASILPSIKAALR